MTNEEMTNDEKHVRGLNDYLISGSVLSFVICRLSFRLSSEQT